MAHTHTTLLNLYKPDNDDMLEDSRVGFNVNSNILDNAIVVSSGNVVIKLGDNAGSNNITIKDSDDVTIAKINSNGGIVSYSQIGYSVVFDNGNSGASKTIDWTKGNKQSLTTTGACTLTFTAPSYPCSLQLIITHNNSATVYNYTYPVSVKWSDGIKFATTNTANAVDILSFLYNGTYYYAAGNAHFS